MHEPDQSGYGPRTPAIAPGDTRRPLPRLLPARPLPAYAYLPGRFPHPVRHPQGHSHHTVGQSPPSAEITDPDGFLWGMDLFNQGYYWEAHEAWEGLWRMALRGSAEHNLLQGLILMAAAGVKLREGKLAAARRHGSRSATFLKHSAVSPVADLERKLGHSADCLASMAQDMDAQAATGMGQAVVFDFALGNPATFGRAADDPPTAGGA